MKKMIFTTLFVFCANTAFAQTGHLPRLIHFDGQLLDSTNNPLTGSQSVTFQILPPTGSCVLHEETQSVTPDSSGNFSVKIGPSSSGTQTSTDGDLDWSLIFQNSGIIVNAGSPTTLCSAYTPASGHSRRLRVIVGATTLSPDFEIASAPVATVAESLQGKTPGDFLSSAGGNLAGNLNLMVGNAVRFYDTDGSNFVSIKSPDLTADVNLIWPIDAGTSGQVLTTNGAGVLSWSTPSGGSGLTSLNGLTGSTQTFATGVSGTSPAFNSSSSVHTLNIPLASGAGVTSGTISNSDYLSFVAKLSSVTGSTLNSGNIWVGNGSNQATPVTMSGDATMSNLGALTINSSAVTTAKLADSSVTTAKLATSSVTDDKIVGVSVNKIINGSGQYLDYAPNNTSCAAGNVLKQTANGWECGVAMMPNQPIVVATGGFSSPSISFMGDSTTGLFRPGTGMIGFSTSGTERLRINNAGNVGIGNSSPLFPLHVGNSVSANNEAAFFAGAVSAQNSDSATVFPIRVQNTFVSTGAGSGILFQGVNTGAAAQTYGSISARPENNMVGSESGSLHFATGGVSNTTVPQMVIKGNGNVGIGTLTPSDKLDIEGGGISADYAKVNDYMRLMPKASHPTACTAIEVGTIYFNSAIQNICICTGSGWRKADGNTTMGCGM